MLERLFRIRERQSTLPTEVMAGFSTFLALSYIFVVNPAMLAEAGMSRSAVFFATVITSAAATLIMGLWTNLPFVLAPGMEINTYVAYFAVAIAGLSWQQALGAVFWSGVLFLLFTASGVRKRIIESLPGAMHADLAATVGALLAAVALRDAGLLVYDGVTLSGFGSIGKPAVVLGATVLVAFSLAFLRVRAAVLVSVIVGSVVAMLLGISGTEGGEVAARAGSLFSGVGAADLAVILRPRAWTIILALFLVDFFGSVAKFVGLLRNTELLRDGKLPRMREALVVDGAAAVTGSMLGTTSVLVYAESGVGIAAGGRTGLTAVVAAISMFACFAAMPLLQYVPVVATGGALLFVAAQLFPSMSELRKRDVWQLAALVGMVAVVLTTFALDRALLLGLALHLMRDFSKGVRLNAYAIGSLGLLVIGWVLTLRG